MYDHTVDRNAFVDTTLFIHYRPSTKVTHGLVLMNLFRSNLPESLIKDTILQIKSSFEVLEYHPISSALALCTQALSENSRQLILIYHRIDALGGRLGYTGDPAEGEDPLDDTGSVDLFKDTSDVQKMAMHLSSVRELVGGQRIVLKRLMAEIENERTVAPKNELARLQDIRWALMEMEGGNDALINSADAQQMQINSLAQAVRYPFPDFSQQR